MTLPLSYSPNKSLLVCGAVWMCRFCISQTKLCTLNSDETQFVVILVVPIALISIKITGIANIGGKKSVTLLKPRTQVRHSSPCVHLKTHCLVYCAVDVFNVHFTQLITDELRQLQDHFPSRTAATIPKFHSQTPAHRLTFDFCFQPS